MVQGTYGDIMPDYLIIIIESDDQDKIVSIIRNMRKLKVNYGLDYSRKTKIVSLFDYLHNIVMRIDDGS